MCITHEDNDVTSLGRGADMQERGLMAFTPGTLRRRTLLEPNPKSEKVLAFAHLAICAVRLQLSLFAALLCAALLPASSLANAFLLSFLLVIDVSHLMMRPPQ